jgi:hypothetical protein
MQESERKSPNGIEAEILIEPDCAFVRADNEVELNGFEACCNECSTIRRPTPLPVAVDEVM